MIYTTSTLRSYQTCPRQFQHRYLDLYSSVEDGKGLEWGIAMHAFLAHLRAHGAVEVSHFAGVTDPYERAKAIAIGLYYAEHQARQGTWMEVERELAFEVHGHPFAGKIDGVFVEAAAGGVYLVDTKTTALDIGHDGPWAQSLTKSAQFAHYVHGLRTIGIHVGACVIDAIRRPLLKPRKDESVHAFEARISADIAERPEFYFSWIPFSTPPMTDTLEDTAFTIVTIEQMLARSPRLPRNTGACFDYHTRCGFWQTCHQGVPLAQNPHVYRRDRMHQELETAG